jgi:hypothetical protein
MQSVASGKSHKHFQNRGGFDRADFIAKRNVFIAQKIALTADEEATFIPLDNELLHKKFEIGRDCRRIERELRDKKDKSDAECQKLLKCREEVKEKRDQLDREYLEKFKKILSAEQMLKYQSADREFFEDYFRDRRN